jgi:hypothetical protein
MRFDIRLRGSTATDKACVMECTVYAKSQRQMEREVEQRAQEGPWFYEEGGETVPQTEHITVLHVQRLVNGKWE